MNVDTPGVRSAVLAKVRAWDLGPEAAAAIIEAVNDGLTIDGPASDDDVLLGPVECQTCGALVVWTGIGWCDPARLTGKWAQLPVVGVEHYCAETVARQAGIGRRVRRKAKRR